MATATKKRVLTDEADQFGSTPYGNQTALCFPFETNASGVYVKSDQAAAIGNGDKVRFGVLPAGMKLLDALVAISDAFTASSTFKLGFEYVDGVDDTSVPQDDDYFILAGTALDATARLRANNLAVRPLVLPKDAYLILTNAGAAQSAAGQMDVSIFGILTGPK